MSDSDNKGEFVGLRLPKELYDKWDRNTAKRVRAFLQGKPFSVKGDKQMNKKEIINYICKILGEYEGFFRLDFLRGQKLVYDYIIEAQLKLKEDEVKWE